MENTYKLNIDGSLQPGTLLQGGRYRIIQTLGQGGFGITYLAEQTDLNIKVCIKEFFMEPFGRRSDDGVSFIAHNTKAANDAETYRKKFIKEAQTLARLETYNNPNIIRVKACFEENNTAYYAMEYIDGDSLHDIYKQAYNENNNTRGISEALAIEYITAIANALDTLHSSNTLHLDVKPSNIMVRHDGSCVLIDFGISKHYDESGRPTSFTPIGITRGFTPIEQYNSDGSSLTTATDIYSLGATLYTLITGEVPAYEADVATCCTERLSQYSNISQGTIAAIERALSAKPADRPQSVGEFMAILKQTRREASAPIPPTPKGKNKDKKRRKGWWIILIILLLLLVAGGVIYYLSTNKEETNNEATTTAATSNTTTTISPTLTIMGDDLISVDHREHNGSIYYAIENPDAETSVEVGCDAEWINLVLDDGKIDYTIFANKGDKQRSTTITIVYGVLTAEVHVEQLDRSASPESSLTFIDTDINLDYNDCHITLGYEIINPVENLAPTATSAKEWIKNIVIDGDNIYFETTVNNGTQSRKGSIEVIYDDKSYTLNVTQRSKPKEPEPYLTLSSSEININAQGGHAKVNYTITNPKKGARATAEADEKWITNIVADNKCISFDVAANSLTSERSTYVYIVYNGKYYPISVHQHSKQPDPKLIVKQVGINAEPGGSSHTIDYTIENPIAGAEVVATTSSSWITALSVDQTKNTISFTVPGNSSPDGARAGEIKVKYGNLLSTITVHQESDYVKVHVVCEYSCTYTMSKKAVRKERRHCR